MILLNVFDERLIVLVEICYEIEGWVKRII